MWWRLTSFSDAVLASWLAGFDSVRVSAITKCSKHDVISDLRKVKD